MITSKVATEKVSQLKDAFWVTLKIIKVIWETDRLLFVSSVLLGIVPATFDLINAYIYKLIIDLVVAGFNSGVTNYDQLYIFIVLRAGTYFAQDLTYHASNYVDRVLWAKFPILLTQRILFKISNLDAEYFENSKFRDLLEKVRNSYFSRPQQLFTNLTTLFGTTVRILIALVALFQLNWMLVALLTILAIPDFLYQLYNSKEIWGIWAMNSPYRKRFNYLTDILDSYHWIKEIKIFGLAKNFLHEVKEIQTKFYTDTRKQAIGFAKTGTLFGWLHSVVYVGVESFIILQALSKKLTIGDIGFYTTVVSQYSNGLSSLFGSLNRIFEHSLYVKSITDLLDLEPLIKHSDNPIRINLDKTPTIEFKDVNFSYPDSEKKILNNFSMTIESGDKVAFVGENGAGKSTIIKLLLRFYDVDSGEILIDGVNIKEISLEDWYKHIGVLFQDFNKYEHKASENIHFGKVDTQIDLEEIIEAARSSGAHSVIEKLKKGYDSVLGKTFEEGEELSVGQWQKVALARAFFRDAPILVLDEPTASIDAKAEAEIFSKVEKLSKDKTVIIISHRFSTVRNADKIYVLDDGKIKESGSHKELMKLDGQYASMFNLQAKGYQ